MPEVAASEVGAPNAAIEKRIACEDPALDFGIKTDAASGMARRANHLQSALPHFDDFVVFQVNVGQRKLAIRRKAEPRAVTFGLNEVRLCVGMRRHWDAITLFHGFVADDMIHVAMRVDGHQRLQLVAVDETEQAVFLSFVGAARVDDDTFLGVVVKDVSVFRKWIEDEFGYDLSMTYKQLWKNHVFECTCQNSVPAAFICWYYSNSYEDCIRKAVSLGGDADTEAAIAGAFAAADPNTEVDDALAHDVTRFFAMDFLEVLNKFHKEVEEK